MKNLFFLALVLLVFSACQKQDEAELGPTNDSELNELIRQYPSEVTIANWEEFVYAPNALIDHMEKERRQEHKLAKPVNKEYTPINKVAASGVTGSVRAFDGSWTPIGGVQVNNGCNTFSTALVGDNYCFFSTACTGTSLCMDYVTGNTNGVSGFDINLINQHILNINPFTDVRQILAADVDRNGAVTAFDIILIRRMILGLNTAWPANGNNGNNVMFISEIEYNDLQDLMDAGQLGTDFYQFFTNFSCTGFEDRYAIKTGDINGSFSF